MRMWIAELRCLESLEVAHAGMDEGFRHLPGEGVDALPTGTMGRHHHGWVHLFYGGHCRLYDALRLFADQVEASQRGGTSPSSSPALRKPNHLFVS